MVFTTLHSWRCQKWSYDRCKQAWIWPCYLPSQCSTVASIWSTAYVVDIDLSNFTKDTHSMNIRMFLDYCDWTKKFEQYLHYELWAWHIFNWPAQVQFLLEWTSKQHWGWKEPRRGRDRSSSSGEEGFLTHMYVKVIQYSQKSLIRTHCNQGMFVLLKRLDKWICIQSRAATFHLVHSKYYEYYYFEDLDK